MSPSPPNAEQTSPLEKLRNNFFKKVFPINILSKLMVNQAYKNSRTSRYLQTNKSKTMFKEWEPKWIPKGFPNGQKISSWGPVSLALAL